MTLLGRETECAALDRIKPDVIDRGSRVLVLRGDPGTGKSALLGYLKDDLHGWQMLTVNGVESETEFVYSGLHQLCAPLLEQHLGRLPPPQQAALATAFGLAAGTPPDRFLVGLGALSLLADAAESEPLACFIDDSQWLDPASAQVLSFVARRLLAEPVALICATRAGPGDDVFDGLPELAVHGLTGEDARSLLLSGVHGAMDPAVVDQIIGECHGNPLALLELPRTWMRSNLAGGYGLLGAPSTTAQKIERSYALRLAQLPPDTQLLALVAAADPLGDPSLLSRAADVLGTQLTLTHPAVEVGLLEVGHRVRFAHPLARSATYRRASADDRHIVHRALAEATDARTDPDRRAWHLGRAAQTPDESVAAQLELSAGRARSRGGVAASAAFLTRAAELTPDPAQRAGRALQAAFDHVQAGSFDAALRLRAQAEEGPLDDRQRASSQLLGAQLTLAASRGNNAAAPLLAAAQELAGLDVNLSRETYLDAFTASLFGARLNVTVDAADVADAARNAPRPALSEPRAVDLLLDGFTEITRDYQEAIPACRAALDRLEADCADVDSEPRWFWHGTVLSLELWDDEHAYLFSEHHAQVARSTGALSQLALALSAHITVLVFRGDLGAAKDAEREAMAVQEIAGIRGAPYGTLKVLAWSGLEHETNQLVDATVDQATSRGEGIGIAVAEYSRAVLCNGLGQYDAAMTAAALATADSSELAAHNWGLGELVEAAVRSGRLDLATEAHRRLARKALASGTHWALGMESRCRALIADGEAAESSYRASIENLRQTTLRSELFRSHLLYGEWLRRANRRTDARDELSVAHEAFEAMGMAAFAARARNELLATGATVRRRTVDPENELTPQEAHITKLARDGMTNAEIGSRLFLSARTVEWHLSKVFRKLDITSRRQLGSAAEQHS
jgi:DNA-binding CsgD family transcriptional regulator